MVDKLLIFKMLNNLVIQDMCIILAKQKRNTSVKTGFI